MLIKIGLDFETRSACDLTTEGAYRYATDPTTQIICCSYKVNGGKVQSWWPDWVANIIGPPPSKAPWAHVTKKDTVRYYAWNSQFDRLIYSYVAEADYDWPRTCIEEWVCTAAIARSNGLPGKLENAARALGIFAQKDARGKDLIKLLSIPIGGTRDAPIFNEDPDLLRDMSKYCDQDEEVEHGMLQKMRPFTERELAEFHANEHVNDRGIGIDKPFAKKALTYGDMERGVLEKQLFELTNGEVERPTQYARVKKWMLAGWVEEKVNEFVDDGRTVFREVGPTRVCKDVIDIMSGYKGGKRKISLDKAVRANIVDMVEEDPRVMTTTAYEVVQLTDLANKSSTAKYKRMLQREIEGRVYGAYMFAGAASTGRFSAQGIQPHNMVRDTVKSFDKSLANLDNHTDTEIIHTLAKMMRQTVTANPGNHLHWSDWSNVEGRACPWLADTVSGRRKLDMFREQDANPNDPDVYERMAALMGLDNRQTGKVAELSLQFGGGIGALIAMSRNYGVRFTNETGKKVIDKWREVNPWAKPFWYALKDAAWGAMVRPNAEHHAGRVSYMYTPDTHNGLGTLWCKLPSGRLLSYVNPKFERVACPWNKDETMVELTALKANFKPKAGESEWPRHKLWYGLLCENVTQGVCADFLRDVLVRFDDQCLDVVLHTHDEVIVDCEYDIRKIVQEIMQTPPSWAVGFPLAADIHRGFRYKEAIV